MPKLKKTCNQTSIDITMWLHYYNPQWIVYLNITGLLVFFVICVYKQLSTTPQPSPIIVFSLDSYFSESDSSKKRDVIFGVCVYFSCCFTVDYLFTFCIIILGLNKIEKFNFCLDLHTHFSFKFIDLSYKLKIICNKRVLLIQRASHHPLEFAGMTIKHDCMVSQICKIGNCQEKTSKPPRSWN
jgi:hypothetical protein